MTGLLVADPQGSPAVSRFSLTLTDVSKRFGPVLADDHVSFSVPAGSIHAIVGENGAGKTTLMRIIYGLYQPDEGTIELNGAPVVFQSPRDALSKGVGMVHQHSLLVNSLSVLENILLSLPGSGPPPWKQVLDELRRLSEHHHLHVDPLATVGALSVASRQRVEILGALFHQAGLLILDEPTSILTPQEVGELFAILRQLREAGRTLLLVTHKLHEVLAISDDVTILRAGRVVRSTPTASLNEREIVRLMVGHDVPPTAGQSRPTLRADGDPVLQVEHLCTRALDHARGLDDINFTVYPGEIVAITGVEGNGQLELTEALVGLAPISGGAIKLLGTNVRALSVGARRRLGMAYIPEDRMKRGISSDVSVGDNLILGHHRRPEFARAGFRRLRRVDQFTRRAITEYQIVANGPASLTGTLSGGNLQKLIAAREIEQGPRLLIAAQPTQGVDVAASHFIRSTLNRLRGEGTAVLLISADLAEVCDLSDRAIVLYNGRIAGELGRAALSEEAIGVLALGLGSQGSEVGQT